MEWKGGETYGVSRPRSPKTLQAPFDRGLEDALGRSARSWRVIPLPRFGAFLRDPGSVPAWGAWRGAWWGVCGVDPVHGGLLLYWRWAGVVGYGAMGGGAHAPAPVAGARHSASSHSSSAPSVFSTSITTHGGSDGGTGAFAAFAAFLRRAPSTNAARCFPSSPRS